MTTTHEIPTIAPITQLDILAINRVVNDINRALERMAEVTATLQGLESRIPSFSNHVNMNGKRITGVGNPKDDTDVCPLGDIRLNGLYAENNEFVSNFVIKAKKGLRVPRAEIAQDAVPLEQVDEKVSGATTFAHTQAAAVTALTDNTSGTANDTLQALTDPADAPATADALRDDLVANLIPELRNNLADLAAKVNEVIAGQKTSLQMAT